MFGGLLRAGGTRGPAALSRRALSTAIASGSRAGPRCPASRPSVPAPLHPVLQPERQRPPQPGAVLQTRRAIPATLGKRGDGDTRR